MAEIRPSKGMTVSEYEKRIAAGEKIELNLITKKDITKQEQQTISKVMSQLGASGRGQSKMRGDAEYYKNLVRIREAKKLKQGLIHPAE